MPNISNVTNLGTESNEPVVTNPVPTPTVDGGAVTAVSTDPLPAPDNDTVAGDDVDVDTLVNEGGADTPEA